MKKSLRTYRMHFVTTFVVAFFALGGVAYTAQAAAYRGYDGVTESLSNQVIQIAEGDAITIDARIKNTGATVWKNSGSSYVSLNVANPFYHESDLAHVFWYSEYQPARLMESSVKPGDVGTFRFALQAPKQKGIYKETFMLSAENTAWLRATEFTITMVVGDVEVKGISSDDSLEARILGQENFATSTADVAMASSTQVMHTEPLIRVGLYTTVDPVILTADTFFTLKDVDGNILQTFDPQQHVVTLFDSYSNTFLVTASGFAQAMPKAQFSGLATSTIFSITNFDNPSKWQEGLNDNRFRGSVEIAYGEKSKSPWVINELLVEDYIKGIKETSQISPEEYQKSIAIAARTYALWHLTDATKHAGNNFTVDAVWDQVYRGVSAEELVPSFSKAVDETEGIVITYDDEIAFTTYFAQSDGRTRNSQEVWGGAYRPWLVAVADPTNEGLRLWGHGVGMSARGALIMASRYGSSYEEILKHYYSGVELTSWYKRGVVPNVIPEATLLADL